MIFEEEFKVIELFLICSFSFFQLNSNIVESVINFIPNRIFKASDIDIIPFYFGFLLAEFPMKLLNRLKELVGVDGDIKKIATGDLHKSKKVFCNCNRTMV